MAAQFHAQPDGVRGKTRAVVVGVSHYQDADIPDLQLAHHDAEAFAAFLMSEGGGRLSQSDMVLLTNEQATTARFATALDWLFEQPVGGQAIIYFAGYGDVKPGSEQFPGFFLLNDAALSPIIAGAFNFSAYFSYHTKGKKVGGTIIANTYPLVLSRQSEQRNFLLNYLPNTRNLEADFSKNLVAAQTFQASSEEIARSKISQNNLLLDGLLGLADRNDNLEVTMGELVHFIRKQKAVPETWPSQLSICYNSKNLVVSKVDSALLSKLSLHSDGRFPSIVHLETTLQEEKLLGSLGDQDRLLYQDFVIAIKLGHLLEPANHCAANLYDSLVHVHGVQPIIGNLRRKLVASLQDEVQQALNAYLRTDIREIERRKKDERYRLYPRYLELAASLLGERHYLHQLLMVKKLYFQGLLYRFEGEQKKDTALLLLAIETQKEAAKLEPQAVFVVNELGVLLNRLGRYAESMEQFKLAAIMTPEWSMPQNNLCHVLRQVGDFRSALEHGELAIQLSPHNVMAINNLGLVQLEMGEVHEAERSFVRAIAVDSDYPESYFNLAILKANQGLKEISLEWLRQSLQKGFENKDLIDAEIALSEVRQMPEFGELMLRFFTDK